MDNDLLMAAHIKSFYQIRDAYAKAGLRSTFDHMVRLLDPENENTNDHASQSQNSSQYEELLVQTLPLMNSPETGGTSFSSSNGEADGDDYASVWNHYSMPEYIFEQDTDDNGALIGRMTETVTVGTDNEDLEILGEIPNSESSLAKSVKGKIKMSLSTRKSASVTQNLLADFGKAEEPTTTSVTSSIDAAQVPNDREVKESSRKTRDGNRMQNGSPSRRKNRRYQPYIIHQSPGKTHFVPDPMLYAKGLINIKNGRINYIIPKILEHFGSDSDTLLAIREARAKNSHEVYLKPKSSFIIATSCVQCLKAAHGYEKYMDHFNEICNCLFRYFPQMSAERWKWLCQTVPE